MSAWLLFISINNFFISFFVMVWIVIKLITVVKHFFLMRKDKEIKAMVGRQLRRFRESHLKMSPARLAEKMKKDFPNDKIQRQTITNQENSPSWSYILWVYEKSKKTLNIEWLFAGEDDPKIPMIKIPQD